MQVHSKCPLCSSERISLHLVCKDHLVSGESFALYKCSACETIFTQDHPPEHEMAKYYKSEGYISHSDSSKGFSNKLYKLARSIMLKKKTRIILDNTGMEKGNLLDV